MHDLYDLLYAIKEKPAMYLGTPSVSSLFMFLVGYNFARREQGIPVTAQEQKFLQFQPWLQQRFSLSTSASWARMVTLTTSPQLTLLEIKASIVPVKSSGPLLDFCCLTSAF